MPKQPMLIRGNLVDLKSKTGDQIFGVEGVTILPTDIIDPTGFQVNFTRMSFFVKLEREV